MCGNLKPDQESREELDQTRRRILGRGDVSSQGNLSVISGRSRAALTNVAEAAVVCHRPYSSSQHWSSRVLSEINMHSMDSKII